MEDGEDSYGGGGSKKKSKKSPRPQQIIKLTESDDGYPRDLPPNSKSTDFDWSKFDGVIREVMDQGNRRTCWTVASTRSLSARLVINERFDPPVWLSALHLLVGLIDRVDSTGGLQNLEHLKNFLVNNGAILEEDCDCPQLALDYKNDPSKGTPVLCTDKGKKSKHTRFFKVEELIIMKKVDEKELIRLVNQGPVAVSLDVYEDFLSFKGSGVYTGSERKGRRLDKHMFIVSGYGTQMPEKIHFWRIQNSAGTTWGENGFGKIVRQISRGKGQPSLFTCVVYPRLLNHYDGQK